MNDADAPKNEPLLADSEPPRAAVPLTADAVMETLDRDLVGRTLGGKYELRRVIGEGGMGRIYLAHQEVMDRYVAVKVLNPGFAEDPRAVARFLREVKAASRLNHPNTIRIYDFGKVDDVLFMVLEVLKGRSLAQIIDGDGPLPTRRAIKVAVQICDSLAEAHQQGVIHRDLKPDNIHIEKMLGNPDHVKVLDFGIAKLQYGDRFASDNDGNTDPNLICGTPSYMSPEQIDGRGDIDERTDVYGLGILLYEMLTGVPPFFADAPFDVLLMQLNDSPPSLPVSSSVPAALSALVDAMLAKERGARPESCHAVRLRLDVIAEQLDTVQRSVRSSADQTMLFGTGLADALDAPVPQKRLVSGRRPSQSKTGDRTKRPIGTQLARATPPAPLPVAPSPTLPASPAPRERSKTPERLKVATPASGAKKAAKSRRLQTGQMMAPTGLRIPTDPMTARPDALSSTPRTRPDNVEWGPDVRDRTGGRNAGATTKPFPPNMASGEEVVAQLMDEISSDDVAVPTPRAATGASGGRAGRPHNRTPTSRRIDTSLLKQTLPPTTTTMRSTPRAPVSLPMQPTRVALQHVDSGDKFDLIASNELNGVLQCLGGPEPAVGSRLKLSGAETRFAHVEAEVEIEGPAHDVPGVGFLRVRWVGVHVRARVMQMKLALDALLSVNPEAVTGWPASQELEAGTVLSYEPASGRLTVEREQQPQASLSERARRPSRVKQAAASPPPEPSKTGK